MVLQSGEVQQQFAIRSVGVSLLKTGEIGAYPMDRAAGCGEQKQHDQGGQSPFGSRLRIQETPRKGASETYPSRIHSRFPE